MATGRSGKIRDLARALSERHGVRIEASYDAPVWRLEWTDGPTRSTVERELAAAADATGGAKIHTSRSLSVRAFGLGALRAAADGGEFATGHFARDSYRAHSHLNWILESVEHPEKAADEQEEALLAILLQEATDPESRFPYPDEYKVCSLMAERGRGWLRRTAAAAPDAPAVARLTALEQLTERYADDVGDIVAWQKHGRTLPARAAVDAALADPDLSPALAIAAIEILRTLHAELDELDTRAARVVRDGVDRSAVRLDDLGTALGGVTKQSAGRWLRARLAQAPTRMRARSS